MESVDRAYSFWEWSCNVQYPSVFVSFTASLFNLFFITRFLISIPILLGYLFLIFNLLSYQLMFQLFLRCWVFQVIPDQPTKWKRLIRGWILYFLGKMRIEGLDCEFDFTWYFVMFFKFLISKLSSTRLYLESVVHFNSIKFYHCKSRYSSPGIP